VAERLKTMPHITVHNVAGNRIALLLETDDLHVIAGSARAINEMKGVKGVFPVFSREALSAAG